MPSTNISVLSDPSGGGAAEQEPAAEQWVSLPCRAVPGSHQCSVSILGTETAKRVWDSTTAIS